MNNIISRRKWYERYRWFFTSHDKLVIGGKSAEQNEEVVKDHIDKRDIVMHTAMPGSPFAVIKSNNNRILKNELKEVAMFTASFSRAWREHKKNVVVHIFKPHQIKKIEGQKKGTFTILGKIKKIKVKPKLLITFQKGKIRAVPLETTKKGFFIITPGRFTKDVTAEKIKDNLERYGIRIRKDEILNALPTGKFNIKKLEIKNLK